MRQEKSLAFLYKGTLTCGGRQGKASRLLFLFGLFFLAGAMGTGCGKGQEKVYRGYYVYCLDANEKKVAAEEYSHHSKETNQLIREFLAQMEQEPKNISFKKAIPDNVELDDYTLGQDGDLCLYWTASYGNYTGVSEILRRAAIVKTLCQVPQVNSIQFYVAGQPLTDSNMNAIGFMTADTFIDNTGEVAYTQTATLNLYFSNYQGTGLVEVPVKITYDATIPLEQLAIEQLIEGPDTIKGANQKRMLKTIPEGTEINKISVKDNTCYLDLSSEFLKKRSNLSDKVAIYSVVNSLVELPNINKVQFSIDGEQVLLFGDHVNFGEPFECNLDIVTQ